MATDKQIAANRANAKKSTGPRSAEGKARASKNAVRHGLSAAYAVLRIEEPDEVSYLLDASIDHYQPRDEEEMQAVERIALAKLSILRCARLEAGMFTHALDSSLNADNLTPFVSLDGRMTDNLEVRREQVRNYALAEGLTRLTRHPNFWLLFLRYQSQSERHYRRAVESFHDLRRKRNSPIEPNSTSEPQQKKPPSPAANEPIPPAREASPLPASISPSPASPPSPQTSAAGTGDRPLAPGPASAPQSQTSTAPANPQPPYPNRGPAPGPTPVPRRAPNRPLNPPAPGPRPAAPVSVTMENPSGRHPSVETSHTVAPFARC